ncbi:hypothetical protein COCON_G00067760 [Conger conger]|uniref:Interleukin-7 n=1 Tax=Conger conger TaxID=82655 RepID=A0A9Q1I449_CONCO|nr:hypothetical protein COCON_G00067760 [Conger conger]
MDFNCSLGQNRKMGINRYNVTEQIKQSLKCILMEWEFLVPSIGKHEPKMTYAPQQVLFGSFLLALLLLPLASSCGSTRPMDEIKTDYMCIIKPLLKSIDENITNLLKDQPCEEMKKKYTCNPNNETHGIHKMVCSIPIQTLKRAMSTIKCDLWKLMRHTTVSLNCTCSLTEFNCTQPHHLKEPKGKQRLCRIRSILREIEKCYMSIDGEGETA